MPHIGSIGEFRQNVETFETYLDRLEGYFDANEIGTLKYGNNEETRTITDKKKVAAFISVIGAETYGTLQDLCKPDKPRNKTFTDLCDLLQQHFKPPTVEVAESFKFFRYVQSERQSIANYSAKLRGMAATCNFGGFLGRALRDQFVCRLRCNDTD